MCVFVVHKTLTQSHRTFKHWSVDCAIVLLDVGIACVSHVMNRRAVRLRLGRWWRRSTRGWPRKTTIWRSARVTSSLSRSNRKCGGRANSMAGSARSPSYILCTLGLKKSTCISCCNLDTHEQILIFCVCQDYRRSKVGRFWDTVYMVAQKQLQSWPVVQNVSFLLTSIACGMLRALATMYCLN